MLFNLLNKPVISKGNRGFISFFVLYIPINLVWIEQKFPSSVIREKCLIKRRKNEFSQ